MHIAEIEAPTDSISNVDITEDTIENEFMTVGDNEDLDGNGVTVIATDDDSATDDNTGEEN